MTLRGRTTLDLAVIGLGASLVVFFAGAAVVLALGRDVSTAFWAAGGAVSGGLVGLFVPPPGSQAPSSPTKDAATTAGDATHLAAVQAADAAASALPPDQKEAGLAAAQAVRAAGPAILAQAAGQATANATVASAANDGANAVQLGHQNRADDAKAALETAGAALTSARAGGDPAATEQAGKQVAQATATAAVLEAAADAAKRAVAPAIGNALSAPPKPRASDTPQAAAAWLLGIFIALLLLGLVLAGGGITPPKSFGAGSIENLAKTVVSLASAAGAGLIGMFAPSPSSGASAGRSAP